MAMHLSHWLPWWLLPMIKVSFCHTHMTETAHSCSFPLTESNDAVTPHNLSEKGCVLILRIRPEPHMPRVWACCNTLLCQPSSKPKMNLPTPALHFSKSFIRDISASTCCAFLSISLFYSLLDNAERNEIFPVMWRVFFQPILLSVTDVMPW